MMFPQKLFFVFTIFCISFFGYGQITTVRIQSSQDSYVDSYNSSTNYDGDTILMVGTYDNNGVAEFKRSFIQFDISSLPQDLEIYSAFIYLLPIDTIGTPSYQAATVLDSWTESSIEFNNQPQITADPKLIGTSTSYSGDTLKINVNSIIRTLYGQLLANNGFCIMNQNERDTTDLATFFSARSDSFQPFIEIKYYSKPKISNVFISHESGTSAQDAFIDLNIQGGSQSFTYEWFDGSTGNLISTDTLLDSISYGWYNLHATGAYNAYTGMDEIYYSFVVGVECDTVTINYASTKEYTNNCMITNIIQSGFDYSNSNYANNAAFMSMTQNGTNPYTRASYLDFNLWMDERFTIQQADLNINSAGHNVSQWRTNECELVRVSEEWNENYVSYNHVPDTSRDIVIFVDSVSYASQDRTVDIKRLWDYWKVNNYNNFGMLFQLESYTPILNCKQHYYSPAYGTASERPTIEFQLYLNKNEASLVTIWDTVKSSGKVTVDITGICPVQSPVSYFLTDEIFDSLDWLIDSLQSSGITVDTSTFLRGMDSELVKEFNDVPMGKYYISVLDNNGIFIYIDSIRVGNVIESNELNNSAFSNDTIYTFGNSYGELELYTYAERNSLLNVILSNVDSSFFIGLKDVEDSTSVNSKIVYGIRVANGKLWPVINGLDIADTINLTGNEQLRLMLSDKFIVNINGIDEYEYESDPTDPIQYEMLKLIYGSNSINTVQILPTNWSPKPIKVKTTVLRSNCFGDAGQIVVDIHNLYLRLCSSTVICTLSDGVNTFYPSSQSGSVYTFNSLAQGIYVLNVDVTQSCPGNNINTFQYNEIIEVMASLDWKNYQESYFNYATDGLLRQAYTFNNPNEFGSAVANHDVTLQKNKVFFKPSGGSFIFSSAILAWDTGSNFDAITPNDGLCVINFFNAGGGFAYKFVGGQIVGTGYNIGSNFKYSYEYDPFINTVELIEHSYNSNTVLFTENAPSYDVLGIYVNKNNTGLKDLYTNMPCNPPSVYAKVERQLKGVRYRVYNNHLYFYYQEEYTPQYANLSFNVYSELDRFNLPITGGTISLNRDFGDERYTLNVSSIQPGAYVLEIINDKNEKFYLRFVK